MLFHVTVSGDRTMADALARASSAMAGFERRWWTAGGWAVDCFVGKRTRPHPDLDIAVLHRDQAVLFQHLWGWDLRLARPGGDFERWDGTALPASFHQVWARSGGGRADTPREFVRDPSFLEFLLESSRDGSWYYRRHAAVSRPVAELGMQVHGVPVLRPEIALLYKSRDLRRRDARDFALAFPRLDPTAQSWLAGAVATAHPESPWRTQLEGSRA